MRKNFKIPFIVTLVLFIITACGLGYALYSNSNKEENDCNEGCFVTSDELAVINNLSPVQSIYFLKIEDGILYNIRNYDGIENETLGKQKLMENVKAIYSAPEVQEPELSGFNVAIVTNSGEVYDFTYPAESFTSDSNIDLSLFEKRNIKLNENYTVSASATITVDLVNKYVTYYYSFN